jgi:hypothetical protein
MSIEVAFENVSIALKNLWQACFMDEEGKPLDWTQSLITSINTPRLRLVVTAVDGGAMKTYTGYELPDNISLTIYETPDRKVEKYLDSWMFGPKGVFNKNTGKFRSRSKNEVTNIYRCVKFSTFLWENEDPEAGQAASVKHKNPDVQESAASVKLKAPDVQESARNAKLKNPDVQESSASVSRKDPNVRDFTAMVLRRENSKAYIKPIVASQQVASQITSLISGSANQLLGHIPAMAVGRVIIPPPLIKKPLQPSTSKVPFPIQASSIENSIKKRKTLESGREELIASIKKWKTVESGKEEEIDSIKKWETLESGEEEEVDSIKKRETLESGEEREETSIKKYTHKEKIFSTTTYTCAIEGYEIAAYDYETGGPVSYTVSLAVLNYKPEYS